MPGCGRPALMPTPVIFAGTGIDPLAGPVDPSAGPESTHRHIYYVTNRRPASADAPVGDASPDPEYTTDRDPGLRLGVATVDLAPRQDATGLRAASLSARRPRTPRPALIGLQEYGALWRTIPPLDVASAEDPQVADAFFDAVRADLDASGDREIFIFVHGYNTHFERNCTLAAELHHYLGDAGVLISYAWPSRGSLFGYGADKANAEVSVRPLRLLLGSLAERSGAKRINIIAHSAGAPIAVGAIRELCLMHFDEGTEAVQARYRLGELVLVAPDMDFGAFENAIHDEIVGVPRQMSIYFSSRDRALDLSAWIFGFARLGQPLTALSGDDMAFLETHPDVSLIDVAAAEKHHGSWLGHSYFHADPWVSSDVLTLLRHRAAPADRGLVRDPDRPIWRFPADYPPRATEAASRLYAVPAAP